MVNQPERPVKGAERLLAKECRSLPGAVPRQRIGLTVVPSGGRQRGRADTARHPIAPRITPDGAGPARAARMVPVTDVYLEVGKKRVFACAADWPGWCRSGRDEEQALEALTTSASRYAVLAALAGVPFDPVAEVDCIEIAETVTGSATTDFGALDVAPALDAEPVTAPQADRLAVLVPTAWDYFEQTAAASPPA